jgi:hypothetical protein
MEGDRKAGGEAGGITIVEKLLRTLLGGEFSPCGCESVALKPQIAAKRHESARHTFPRPHNRHIRRASSGTFEE